MKYASKFWANNSYDKLLLYSDKPNIRGTAIDQDGNNLFSMAFGY